MLTQNYGPGFFFKKIITGHKDFSPKPTHLFYLIKYCSTKPEISFRFIIVLHDVGMFPITGTTWVVQVAEMAPSQAME